MNVSHLIIIIAVQQYIIEMSIIVKHFILKSKKFWLFKKLNFILSTYGYFEYFEKKMDAL